MAVSFPFFSFVYETFLCRLLDGVSAFCALNSQRPVNLFQIGLCPFHYAEAILQCNSFVDGLSFVVSFFHLVIFYFGVVESFCMHEP